MSKVDSYLNLLQEIDHHASLFRAKVDDCSLIEFRIMELVDRQPDLCLHDISRERFVVQQGVGRLAKRLHKRGLVDVVRSERDQRAKHVILTRKGKQVKARCRDVLMAVLNS